MKRGNKFKSVIIGSGTLPILCARVLLSRGHEICFMITSDAEVQRWTRETKIPYLEPYSNLAELLSAKPFDYLFSVANEQILRGDVLKLPRKAAINYHDSLLPRYAGTHATSWALMNGETVHGVTWHLMTEVVDAGDILKQECVGIAEDDTALTLNMKCYEAAINSFTRLVGELETGNVLARKQNLDERSFFPRYQRPAIGGVISWRHCASAIDTFVRALNFNSHANPLGSPKLAIGNEFVIVPEIVTLPEPSLTAPGTITKIGSDFLRVDTADRQVELQSLLTPSGEPISIAELVARYGLHPGYRFTDLDSEQVQQLESLDAASSQHQTFWVERLASLAPAVLPYRKSTVSDKVPRFASLRMLIPNEVVNFVKERLVQWTIGDFILAAYGTFIARLADLNSFDIAYTDSDLKDEVAGFDRIFAMHLPLRMDIDCSQSFAEILNAVKKQVESVRNHSSYSLDLVARYPELRSIAVCPGRFTLPLVFERGKRSKDNEMPAGCEIMLNISEDGVQCHWIYDQDKFEEASIVRLSSLFTTLLSGISAKPEHPLASLPLLTEQERHQVLIEWNDNHAEYPTDQCIHQMFEDQVVRTPDADALIFGGRQLTYLELNHRANQLAHFLRRLGVGPETPVGICVERSMEMVIGMLAVLKAGAAYLPLDPAYPRERLAFMLRDSEAPVLLTQAKLAAGFNQDRARMVCLDTDWKEIAEHSERNPYSEVRPENLAYILYTSGSTGHPKGVLIPHSALVSHSVSVANHYEIVSSDRVLQFASISFDVAAEELFATLLSGAAVVLPTWQSLPSLSDFIALLEKERLTVINLPSCYWHELVLELDLSKRSLSPTLRLVVAGSERVLPERLRTWRKMFGNSIRWLNAYGPTEATVTTTIYEPNGADEGSETVAVPIGRPMANRQVYILDSHLDPVPIGVRGELYIGGAGLARGYLNSSDLTVEKFIPNVFKPEAGSKLYKTGDKARYLHDGNIEFLGRVDRQVKVRGFRIELDEIENTLDQHPSIRNCAVLAREDEAGDTKLVAFIAPAVDKSNGAGSIPLTPFGTSGLKVWNSSRHDPSQAVSRENLFPVLLDHLREKLPEYMVPSALITLDQLPVLPNGKVDRQALSMVDLSKCKPANPDVSHRDLVEVQLTEIWERVLGVRPIGLNDNFFELGGHSLQAVRMFAEVEKAFCKNIPIGTLFQAGSIKKLAQILREDCGSAPVSSLVAVQPNGSQAPFFCIHPLGGDVLLYRDLARHLGPDQPFYGLRALRSNGQQVGQMTVEAMAEHYIREIQTIQPRGPYFLGGLSFGGVIAFEMAQQLSTFGQKVALLALFDTELFPTSFRSKLHYFERRLRLHMDRLMMLNFRARVDYVKSRVQKIRKERLNDLNNQYRRAGHQFYSLIGQPPPKDFFAIQDEIWRSGKNYVPKLYPGKITLFRADQARGIYPDPMLGWEGLATDGLEVHEVSGSDHESIVLEPHVGTLAKELRSCIEKTIMERDQAGQPPDLCIFPKTGMHLSMYLAMSSIFIQ